MKRPRWIDKAFRLEEINGRDRCPTYLYRWTLLKVGAYSLYVHHFVGDDWSLDLHDHPKRFISIGLKGWYVETTPCPDCAQNHRRVYRAPWIRTFPAEHRHRIQTPSGSCWTLVITLKSTRGWGFWHLGKFIPWRTYVESETADSRKACQ